MTKERRRNFKDFGRISSAIRQKIKRWLKESFRKIVKSGRWQGSGNGFGGTLDIEKSEKI